MSETKICKQCKSEIDKKAKVCPNCRKKQGGGCLPWVIGFIVIFFIIPAALGESSNSNKGTDDEPKKVGEVGETKVKNEEYDNSNNEQQNNEFSVGSIVEAEDLKISFISANEWNPDNDFFKPKEGNVFYRFEFEFENISDSDQYIQSFECYADGYSMESKYYGDDTIILDSISSGKKLKGAVYFEIPKDAKEIVLEYETDFWKDSKIIFKVK